MSLLFKKIIHLFFGGLICLVPAEKLFLNPAEEGDQRNSPGWLAETENVKGYRDIIFYNRRYITVGTDGRIDYISNSGEKAAVVSNSSNNLNCVTANDKVVVVGGDNGTILFSSDGKIFSTVESGTNDNINGITCNNRLFIAGGDGGTILISKNGVSWSRIKSEVKGNIVSVTANDSFFIGVTGRGEILISKDGFNWQINDYNKEYSGYNKSCVFKKILAINNRIVIIGRHDDNSPAVLFSSLGNVWTERALTYYDEHGMIRFLTNEPNDITYDPVHDQFILACDNGELFSLPSCTKCNVSVTVSNNDLYAVICTYDLLLSAGEDFSINILKF
jgi:hypothetical protein